jgi:hypothetical protein
LCIEVFSHCLRPYGSLWLLFCCCNVGVDTYSTMYQCRKTTVNMKVSGFCYCMHFHYYWLPFKI